MYLASVGLVAAAIIVLFSVASFSLLGTSKETLIPWPAEIGFAADSPLERSGFEP